MYVFILMYNFELKFILLEFSAPRMFSRRDSLGQCQFPDSHLSSSNVIEVLIVDNNRIQFGADECRAYTPCVLSWLM